MLECIKLIYIKFHFVFNAHQSLTNHQNLPLVFTKSLIYLPLHVMCKITFRQIILFWLERIWFVRRHVWTNKRVHVFGHNGFHVLVGLHVSNLFYVSFHRIKINQRKFGATLWILVCKAFNFLLKYWDNCLLFS